MHVLVGDSVEALFTSHVTLVESAIPALIPLISSAAGRTDTGSVWCQLMCTSTKNNWQRHIIIVLVTITQSIVAVTSESITERAIFKSSLFPYFPEDHHGI